MATRRTKRAARPVPSTVPTRADGKVDMVELLKVALTVPGNMSRAFNRFHKYSYMNMLLAYMQTGRLEPMATYKRWGELKRQVVKGSKAIFINHPKFAPVLDDNGELVRDEKGAPMVKVVGFVLKPTVFQLHQTEGPELQLPALPDWDREKALASLQITEEPFSEPDGNCQGYSYTRNGKHFLALNPVAEHPFSTLIHEVAHIVLGHTSPDYPYRGEHRGIAEFQAEAVSLLVCKELGQDGNESSQRAYIQHWLAGRESDYLSCSEDEPDEMELVQDGTVRAIFQAVDKILTAGRDTQAEEAAA